jgi:probable rRNA maturation factor
MKVSLDNSQKDLKIYKRPLQKLVEVVLSLYSLEPDLVYISFVTDKAMREMHAEHFQDPTDTDCMSFPIDPEGLHKPHVLGEIVVCPKTAIIYSQQNQKDPYEELALYVIHGLLHCMGYDDISAKDRKKMRQEEAYCMKAVKEQNISLNTPVVFSTVSLSRETP